MSEIGSNRILSIVADEGEIVVDFTDCFLNKCGNCSDDEMNIGMIESESGYRFVTGKAAFSMDSILLTHSSACPFRSIAALNSQERSEIASGFQSSRRQIKFAVVVLAEDELGRILLSRRRDDAVIFPSVWVLPGGHVEAGESLAQAGARELEEETGISVDPTAMKPLLVWESAFPAALSEGVPRSHHLVMAMHARVHSTQKLSLQESEVAAAVWADRELLLSWLQNEESNSRKPGSTFRFSSELVHAAFAAVKADCDFVSVRPGGFAAEMNVREERLALGHRYVVSRWLHMKMSGAVPVIASMTAAAAEVV